MKLFNLFRKRQIDKQIDIIYPTGEPDKYFPIEYMAEDELIKDD